MTKPPLHILITGASAGIGAQCARLLAAGPPVRLSLAARRLERLENLAAELRAPGVEIACFHFDAGQRESVLELARQARAAFGELDVWISNAGAGLRHNLLDATEEQMLAQFRLNCLSALWAYQAVLPDWLASGHAGQIIDVCSLGGKSGYAFNGAYSAAKHGMSAIGDTLRQELQQSAAGRRICVTSVYPGPTVSDFGASAPDLTGGAAVAQVGRSRSSRNLLARAISSRQSTEHVARAIVRTIRSRQPSVYPHRWGSFGVLLNNLLPGLVLSLYRRSAARSEV
ncbi:SDR family NAD(P)-dependent oxidoreductase [bacterium]|nr:SDR family NAD(P)-dependent oxidoreductase [bacterium]